MKHPLEELAEAARNTGYLCNPLTDSCVEIMLIDKAHAAITITWVNAENNSPVPYIKPDMPGRDRVLMPGPPKQRADRPKSLMNSAVFD